MKRARGYFLDFLFILMGNCVYAVAVNMFTAPNNIAPGGVTGFATLLNYMLDTPIGTVVFIINIPIVIWAVIEIGYKLVLKSFLAIVLMSLTIDVFALFIPVYNGDLILTSLIAGILEGVGLSLVFIRGATTGGTDMIARLLGKRFRHLSMGKLMLTIDGIVIVGSGIVYNSLESAMYACIVVFVATKIIDTILYGTDAGTGKIFYIFSAKNQEIADKILIDLDRGVTYLKAKGGYTMNDMEVLLCAVRRFEIYRIHSIIREVDKDAFVIVGDAGEITGEGFKPHKVDDKTLKELMNRTKKEEK